RRDNRDWQMSGDLRGLIETPLALPGSMQWNRYRRIGAGKDAGARACHQIGQRARQRSMTGIFECMDDRAERAGVFANGAAVGDGVMIGAAAWTPIDSRSAVAP